MSESNQLPEAAEPDPNRQMDLFDASGASAQQPLDADAPAQVPALLPHLYRTPNFGDALIFLLLLCVGMLVAAGAVGIARHYHLIAKSSLDGPLLALSVELTMYCTALAVAIPLFRASWGKGFFRGVHWRVATAYRLRFRLVGIAFLGFLLASVASAQLPFPKDAPIEKIFDSPVIAWVLLCFGITVAPFFEEMIFRGFLLPAMATAWDWCRERWTGAQPHPNDEHGHPVWSRAAMIFAALMASVPFAAVHGQQVAFAWAPLLLLYCVSVILCAVRLITRSLAASTLVHSAYNSILFAGMLWATGGFRHFDKLS